MRLDAESSKRLIRFVQGNVAARFCGCWLLAAGYWPLPSSAEPKYHIGHVRPIPPSSLLHRPPARLYFEPAEADVSLWSAGLPRRG